MHTLSELRGEYSALYSVINTSNGQFVLRETYNSDILCISWKCLRPEIFLKSIEQSEDTLIIRRSIIIIIIIMNEWMNEKKLYSALNSLQMYA